MKKKNEKKKLSSSLSVWKKNGYTTLQMCSGVSCEWLTTVPSVWGKKKKKSILKKIGYKDFSFAYNHCNNLMLLSGQLNLRCSQRLNCATLWTLLVLNLCRSTTKAAQSIYSTRFLRWRLICGQSVLRYFMEQCCPLLVIRKKYLMIVLLQLCLNVNGDISAWLVTWLFTILKGY